MASPPLLTPTIVDLGGWLHKGGRGGGGF